MVSLCSGATGYPQNTFLSPINLLHTFEPCVSMAVLALAFDHFCAGIYGGKVYAGHLRDVETGGGETFGEAA